MKYLFEIILEDDLLDLKQENRIKESLIQVANDQINDLSKENQYKIKTIRKANEEILKEMKLNSELLKENNELALELKNTQETLKISEVKIIDLKEIILQLERDLNQTKEHLNIEKQEKADLVKINNKLEATFEYLKSEAKKFEELNKLLNNTLKARNSEILLLKAELKVQRDHVDDIQYKMKVLKDDIVVVEDKNLDEKKFKIKLEKQKEALNSQLEELKYQSENVRAQTASSNELKRSAEFELNKFKIDLEDEQRQHLIAINSLKKRHEDTVNEMNSQIQKLFIAKTKLEKDRLEQSKNYEAPVIKKELTHAQSIDTSLNLDEKFESLEMRRRASLRLKYRRDPLSK